MSSHASNAKLLFTNCINLNSRSCRYTKKPETILSLFSDPENFAVSDQKIHELNDICSQCDSYHMPDKLKDLDHLPKS